jgi:DNA (cytosine-5)-methyltransferase 1
LEAAGYNNYYAVLNLKDYGRPQNRERLFIVSVRKDIDKGFTFPIPIPLNKTLSDYIESGSVDRDISLCITARYGGVRGSQDYMRRRYLGKSICQLVYENTNREEQLSFYRKNRYGIFECNGYLRALNERECFCVMGFDSGDADKCRESGISIEQLYKQAGNSIGVSVLEAIYKSLAERYDEFKSSNLFEVAV